MRVTDVYQGWEDDDEDFDYEIDDPGGHLVATLAPPPAPSFDRAPGELKRLAQWVVWRHATKPDGRPTKYPYRADGGGMAKVNDPSDWTSFDEATAAYRESRAGAKPYDGVGFVFAAGDGYVGIDFDGCLDGGEIAEWAKPWLERLKGCYVEASPSSRGFKVWARGELPGAGGSRVVGDEAHTGAEIYDQGRYFAVTGDALSAPDGPIPDRQDAIDDLYRWIKERPERTSQEADRPREASGRGLVGGASAERRAAAYLARVDPAVSGQGGHGKAFRAACAVGPGFNLPPEVAYQLLEADYNPRCDPPWSPRELRHKVNEAYKVEKRRGWLLEAGPESAAPSPSRAVAAPAAAPGAEPIGLAETVDNEYRLARIVLKGRYGHPDGPTIRHWRGEWHVWRKGAWRPTPDVEVNAAISGACRAEFEHQARDDGKPVRSVGTKLVGNVAAALRQMVILPESEIPEQPTWLDGGGPDPTQCLNFPNGVLHLPTLVERGPAAALIPPTPRFFTPNVLEYDFDPNPPEPVAWLRFLDSIWPDDPESVQALQQWFGYLLTPDTSRQKALMIVGRPRSGKGTMGRLVSSLVGEANTVSPTPSSLGTPFGLQRLIGKTVATCAETRLTSRSDGAAIVESILSITGEDEQSIDRKYAPPWKGRLRTRFVFTANELPRLTDASKALMSRLVILELPISFVGREDHGLEAKLRSERAAILLWSLAGWERLDASGRFIQPESSMRAVREMEELSDPIGMFVADCCEAAADLTDADGSPARVSVASLYSAFQTWSQQQGRDMKGRDATWFGTKLKASCPFVEKFQARAGRGRERFYRNIRLRTGY